MAEKARDDGEIGTTLRAKQLEAQKAISIDFFHFFAKSKPGTTIEDSSLYRLIRSDLF